MFTTLVMTLLGADRPGLVRSVSDVIASHGGSWQESRMARLAGQFAGIARVECPADHAQALIQNLEALAAVGLTVQVVRESAPAAPPSRTLSVNVVGNDRPGIVRDLSTAIATAGGNVEELNTSLESAPMSGQPLFRAHAIISIPESADPATVIAAIEQLGGDLSVDVA
jgi:glycine cleavage system regulatory protein